jgi:hypothetical protein
MSRTYGFVYSGYVSVGMGVFRVDGTELVGVDLAGGRYRGQVVVDPATGEIDFDFEMTVPAGGFLVQGTSPINISYTKTVSVKKLPADFGDGKPFEVYVPPGKVTMMVKRIPDEYSSYADGVSVDIRPLA